MFFFREKGNGMRIDLKKTVALVLVLAALMSAAPGLRAQEPPPAAPGSNPGLLRVFLDGSGFGSDYVRTEISFVSYVRDRTDADVHIITTSLYSGAGAEYRIEMIGLGKYEDLHFTLKYFADRLATYDEMREGFVRVLKKGLMPYVSRTEAADQVKISYEKGPDRPAPALSDPWDSWIFSLSLNGNISGETSYGSKRYSGGLSASRTTEAVKIRASGNASVNKSRYTIEEEDYDTSTRNWSFGASTIWSLAGHWSAGFSGAASSSTYGNVETAYRISPALEFSVFPYTESTRRELTILYRLTYAYNRYMEETIYDKTAEGLWSQSLTISLDITQPWGSANASIVGSHYFHDWSKNRLSLYGYGSFRVWKGFSFNINGSFAMIHDQLSLAKGTLTKDEIFLQLKQLSTTYDFYVSMGFSFSFGSKMSRAVNPRMSNIEYY